MSDNVDNPVLPCEDYDVDLVCDLEEDEADIELECELEEDEEDDLEVNSEVEESETDRDQDTADNFSPAEDPDA